MSITASVIIPLYNQGSYLERAVSSAVAACSEPLQVIVVNDGSTESGTAAYIRNVERLGDFIEVIEKPNGGLSSARNAGIERARGQFIQFLDADDMLSRGKIDAQLKHLQLFPGNVSVCNYVLCDDRQDATIESPDSIGRFELSLDDFLFHWERGFSIPIHCALFRRTVFDQGVRFDESLVGKEDWRLWCEIVANGARLAYVPLLGAIYRQHSRSMTKFKRQEMGQSWLTAVAAIKKLIPRDKIIDFETASISWYRQYYLANYLSSIETIQSTSDISTGTTFQADAPESDADREQRILDLARSFGSPQTSILFSVVVPVFNHYLDLLGCITSILSQSPTPAELIIVDDCSTDFRVKKFLDRLLDISTRIKVVFLNKNCGMSFAQNVAAGKAVGEYLCFVDCDDELLPSSLRYMWDEIKTAPDVDYFFTDRLDVDADKQVIRCVRYGGYDWLQPSGNIAIDLLDGMVASHLKVIRRSSYLGVGGCSESLSGVQDWDLALRVAQQGRLRYVNEALYQHKIHAGSVTQRDSTRQFRLTNVVRRKYSDLMLRPAVASGLDATTKLREAIKTSGEVLFAAQGVVTTFASAAPENGRQLRELLGRAQLRLFVEDQELDQSTLNFLREWNSYFDLILVSTRKSYVGLIGYVWEERVVEYLQHFNVGTAEIDRITSK